jgi:hypothetical protein
LTGSPWHFAPPPACCAFLVLVMPFNLDKP